MFHLRRGKFISIIAGFYIDVHPFVDKIATKLGYEGRQYAVIIDAGSTGSRVLAYTFHTGYSGRILTDETDKFDLK